MKEEHESDSLSFPGYTVVELTCPNPGLDECSCEFCKATAFLRPSVKLNIWQRFVQFVRNVMVTKA